ncbi:MAG: hypothetical protein Q4G05_06155 [Clostridia bacterium]|nr:hypothetical protein [Clostridia bacterium]
MYLREYIKENGTLTEYPIFDGKESVLLELPVTDLFLAQYVQNKFNAIDIVIKYMAIENYYGQNDYGFDLYKKMQLKRVNEDWSERYIKLIKSYEYNKNVKSNIELDLNYSIHDGAHRMALSLYHIKENILSEVFNIERTRREYGINWFKENNFNNFQLQLIDDKLNELFFKCRKEYYCILWTPARRYFKNIRDCIKRNEEGIKITEEFPMKFNKEELKDFIYSIYETDDIRKEKLDLKYGHIMKSLEIDNYYQSFYTIYVLKIKINNPDFRLKPLTGLPQSKTTMRLKKAIRDEFQQKITAYYYDIIMHMTDNQIQNDAVEKLIKKSIS